MKRPADATGAQGPIPENSAPPTIGPATRASEPEALAAPSTAPCRSGWVARETMAVAAGCQSALPTTPAQSITEAMAAHGAAAIAR